MLGKVFKMKIFLFLKVFDGLLVWTVFSSNMRIKLTYRKTSGGNSHSASIMYLWSCYYYNGLEVLHNLHMVE